MADAIVVYFETHVLEASVLSGIQVHTIQKSQGNLINLSERM